MRIAISGSHSLGKSTFVQDFLEKHANYHYEQEPYRALMNQYEIKFAEDQTQQHILLQFNYCINRVKQYKKGDFVIFDRSPVDFIPYSLYSVVYGHQDIDQTFVNSLYPQVQEALNHLDLIVFIPISPEHPIDLEDDGHRPTHSLYREWVDKAFKDLYRNNLHQITSNEHLISLIEIVGNREERIRKLECIIRDTK